MRQLIWNTGYTVNLDDDDLVCVASDPNDIPRCYGYGKTSKEAQDQCLEAMKDFVLRRPDTGPLDKWHIAWDIKLKD